MSGIQDIGVDMWAATSILAEMALGERLFDGHDKVQQLFEMVRIMGTPSQSQLECINPKVERLSFPVIKCHLMEDLFKEYRNNRLVELLRGVFKYDKKERLSPY